MRGILIVVVLVAFASYGAGQPEDAAADPYVEELRFQGRIACSASVPPGVGLYNQCAPAGDDGTAAFPYEAATGLTGFLVELSWEPVATTGARELLVEVLRQSQSGDLTDAAQPGEEGPSWRHASWGTSPVRLAILPVDPAIGGETLAVRVRLPDEGDQARVAHDQPFQVDVTALYGLPPAPVWDASSPAPDAPAPERPAAESGSRAAAPPGLPSSLWAGGLALAAVPMVTMPRIRRGLGLLTALLFSRMDQDRVLDHPRRALLLDAVKAQPGIRAEELRKRLRLGNGAFEHHVRILHRHRVLRRHVVEGHVLLFPAHVGAPMGDAPLRTRLLEEVRRAPGPEPAMLSQRLGVPVKRVRYHARNLARSGRLRLTSEGRTVRYWPSPDDLSPA